MLTLNSSTDCPDETHRVPLTGSIAMPSIRSGTDLVRSTLSVRSLISASVSLPEVGHPDQASLRVIGEGCRRLGSQHLDRGRSRLTAAEAGLAVLAAAWAAPAANAPAATMTLTAKLSFMKA